MHSVEEREAAIAHMAESEEWTTAFGHMCRRSLKEKRSGEAAGADGFLPTL